MVNALVRKFACQFTFILVFGVFTSAAQVASEGGRFEVDFDTGCAPFTININYLLPRGPMEVVQYDHDGDGLFQDLTTFTYDEPGTYTLREIRQNLTPPIDQLTITVLDNPEPQFEVFNCSSNSAFVEITDTYYDRFEINFGEGAPIVVNSGDPVPPFSYSSGGVYNVSVRGIIDGAKDNCSESNINITTVNTLTPAQVTTLTVLNQDTSLGELVITYNSNPDISYDLEESLNGTTGFTQVGQLPVDGLFTISGRNTEDNFYCYRIRALDRCTGISVFSDTICSILLNPQAINNANEINWNTENLNFGNLDINRDNSIITTQTTFAPNQHVDINVNCSELYCYEIEHRYNNGLISNSAEICVEAISTDIPIALNPVTASVMDEEVQLTWDLPSGFVPETYYIYMSENGGALQLYDSTNQASYTDPESSFPETTVCYLLTYQDVCGNVSEESTEACPILLNGINPSGSEIQLDWTEYILWEEGVSEYIVEVLDETNSILNTIPVGLTTTYTENARQYGETIVRYRIRATGIGNPILITLSNVFEFKLEVLISTPNAFHPGSSIAENQTFKPIGLFFQNYRLKVFNRWGEMVFSTSDPNEGWDGTYNGKPLPTGTFAFRIDVTGPDGKNVIKTGTVTLIR